jgi:short-subunit dehydrogenase
MVMKAEDLVDAALKGLASGEVVTIPPLQDGEDWLQYEQARKSLSQKFANNTPGKRYA